MFGAESGYKVKTSVLLTYYFSEDVAGELCFDTSFSRPDHWLIEGNL